MVELPQVQVRIVQRLPENPVRYLEARAGRIAILTSRVSAHAVPLTTLAASLLTEHVFWSTMLL